MPIIFKTTVKGKAEGPTGIEVPPEVIEALGKSKRPPVKVSFSGYSYRSTVAVMDGKFMISLSKAHREAAGVKAGDPIEVTLELDEEPRTVEIPHDLMMALAETPGAFTAFEKASYSTRKEYVRQVESAKAPATRQRRINKIAESLRDK